MLNWASRYFPILRALREELGNTGSILEVGSGSIGLGQFYSAPFVGCDLTFPIAPKSPMLPVVASATTLPFRDRSFDAVVVSDVLEHVPPQQRMTVVQESLRVTNKVAVFGFPSGDQAAECDRKLAQAYDSTRQHQPVWLQEHMQYQPFPTEALFKELRPEWNVRSVNNEHVTLHHWIMRVEMRRLSLYFFRIMLAVFPRVSEYLLRCADRGPCYRKIVIVRRCEGTVACPH